MQGPAQGTAAYHQWSQHSCQNIHHQTTNYWMIYYSSKININRALHLRLIVLIIFTGFPYHKNYASSHHMYKIFTWKLLTLCVIVLACLCSSRSANQNQYSLKTCICEGNHLITKTGPIEMIDQASKQSVHTTSYHIDSIKLSILTW